MLLALVFPCARAPAGDWTITPRTSLKETFSDNIRLDPPGRERADFVTDVSPGISVHGKGRRLKLDLDYTLQGLFYARGTQSPGVNHKLQAAANAEVLKRFAFIDVHSTVSQQNVSAAGRLAESNVSVTGNRTTVGTYIVSPYLTPHFGSFAQGELRYTRDGVLLGSNSAGATDSTSNAYKASLKSGPRFARAPWSLSYNRRKVDYTGGATDNFQRFNGELHYRITRIWGLVLGGGYENSNYQHSSSANSPDGFDWRVGGTWTPSPRTSLQATYGQRFFGNDYSFKFSHHSRRTVWSAGYSEDVTSSRQAQLGRQVFPLTDAFGNRIPPSAIEASGVPLTTATLTNQVEINRSLQGDLAVRGRRTTASFNAFMDEHDFQLTNDTERVFGFSTSGRRTLSHETSVGLSGRWQRTLPRAGSASDLWSARVFLSHRLGRNLSTRLDYSHTSRGAGGFSAATNEYEENRVTATVQMTF